MTELTSLGDRLVPALLASDMRETLSFYQKLGFEVTGTHPSEANPVWAELQRDEVIIQFHSEAPFGTPSRPVCSGTFYLFPQSVSALAQEFEGKVDFAWGPEVMDYGMHEFGVQDPNGYYLAFAEPA